MTAWRSIILHRTRHCACSLAVAITVLLPALAGGCGGEVVPGRIAVPGGPADQLTADDVTRIITQAAASLRDGSLVIAVVDREGNLLGLFRKSDAPETTIVRLAGRVIQVDANELAIAQARTGAFFSSDQAPLSSRTVQFISREHFPATIAPDGTVTGVPNTPSGALWNIESTNRGCFLSDDYIPGQEITPARSLDGSEPGLGIATVPGGVPLYKFGKLVGGVGVAGNALTVPPNVAEFAAVSGETGFAPNPAPPGVIFIDGVRLPFVEQTTQPPGTVGDGRVLEDGLESVGDFVPIPDLENPGSLIDGPQGALRANVPEGWLVGPKAGTQLLESEVRSIVLNCVARANQTRGIIRLPLEARAKFVIAVTDLDGEVLGLYRMPDATVFSIDVAVTKARNVVYFSGYDRTIVDLPGVPFGTAITNRTLRFGSQPFYPPGIRRTEPGPFFPLLLHNLDNPCTQGFQPANENQSGIVFFPGSAALYRGGFLLIGGLGVSGDGVDQDDYVTAAGTKAFKADDSIRANQIILRGARLPYLKFPRQPE